MNLELLRKKWVPMAILGASILLIIIIIVALTVRKAAPIETISIAERLRVDCHPDPNAAKGVCLKRGCVWEEASEGIDAPSCYYPPSFGYKLVEQLSGGSYTLKKKVLPTEEQSLSQPIEELSLTTEFFGNIAHLKFVDKKRTRYEVPLQLWPGGKPASTTTSQVFQFNVINDTFAFSLGHPSGRTMLDTSIGGFIYNDQFLQIANYLGGDVLYGFGENPHQTFRHNLSTFKTWPMFARDQPPWAVTETRQNLYGVHPFCMVLDDKGNAYGLLFWNSNAQEYTTGPGPSLVYRTIGGILDIYVFAGPTPADVIKQYWSLIGKPMLPTYWSLGFQLCRYGYANTSVVREVIYRMREMEIPQDVQYVDIDYMDKRSDFTLDETNFKDLPELVEEERKKNMRWVFIIDPALNAVREKYEPFISGKNVDAYITWPNKSLVPTLNDKYDNTRDSLIMLGTVWPSNNTAFPDFFHSKVNEWWADQIANFHKKLNFDGIWIDMNEPANFGTNEVVPWYESVPELKGVPQLMCPENPLDNPPYATQAAYFWNASLAGKTLCMIGKQGQYYHYDVHNLYGWSETEPSLKGVRMATNSRGFLLSRSTFPTSGQFTGHWLGDNYATWDDLRISIIGMLEFNMFGIPYVGADICGFNENTNEELCARWQQLGAFYTFSRNHNGKGEKGEFLIEQDPTRWPVVALAAKYSLRLRYYYLPYLYTLFYKANSSAEMVVRPLSFEFPYDKKTVDIDRQFMWGPAMLITPCLEPNVTHVVGYFPNAVWYRIDEAFNEGSVTKPGSQMLRAPLAGPPPVHIRGGFILPRQMPALNTAESRLKPMELLITNGSISGDLKSTGDLYWDNGEALNSTNCSYFFTFTFHSTANDATLNITKLKAPVNDKAVCELSIQPIGVLEFYGLNRKFIENSFTLNGEPVPLENSNIQYETMLNKVTVRKDKLIELEQMKENSSVLYWKLSA